jgi:hypothetical protein
MGSRVGAATDEAVSAATDTAWHGDRDGPGSRNPAPRPLFLNSVIRERPAFFPQPGNTAYPRGFVAVPVVGSFKAQGLRLTGIESKVGCRRPTVGHSGAKVPVDPRKFESFCKEVGWQPTS